jgi:hypothetical protein
MENEDDNIDDHKKASGESLVVSADGLEISVSFFKFK